MGRTRITSDGITDGAIVNADVNASAAIAGTKISPDFGSQNITTTGDITVSGGDVIIQGTEAKLHLTDTNNDDDYLVFNNNGTFKVYDATNNADRVQINSDGQIGIGAAAISTGALVEITRNTADAFVALDAEL